MSAIEKTIQVAVDKAVKNIKQQLHSRAVRGANELRSASMEVLRGSRSGRTYRLPHSRGSYRASAPGEPPAVRTGAFRLSWQPSAHSSGDSHISRIESDYSVADWLENGTPGGQMAPRPHHERIQEKALPNIISIYSEPYE